MIDHKLTPNLIEINQCPSFATDSSLDYRIKRGLLTDCFKTLCLNIKRKKEYKKEIWDKMNNRLMQKPAFVKKPKDEGKDKDGNPELSEFKELQSQYEKE